MSATEMELATTARSECILSVTLDCIKSGHSESDRLLLSERDFANSFVVRFSQAETFRPEIV